jgi:hypothetical protein
LILIYFDLKNKDNRFPNGAPFAPKNATYALALPIVQADNTLIGLFMIILKNFQSKVLFLGFLGVLELYRKKDLTSFHEEDEEVLNNMQHFN